MTREDWASAWASLLLFFFLISASPFLAETFGDKREKGGISKGCKTGLK
jgi:hypothetical protein